MKITLDNLTFHYGNRTLLNAISMEVPEGSLTAITGPSGEGKSSLLSLINGMWHAQDGAQASGTARLRLGDRTVDLLCPRLDLPRLRQKAAMVFQNPTPLPFTIFKNVALPLTFAGIKDRSEVASRVQRALRRAGLWEEVHERLDTPATQLSGGQQQRLAMARALVTDPEVLLLDEPTSSLDTASREGIESQLLELKTTCTLLLVSHSEAQVKRLADRVYTLSSGTLQRER